MAGVAGAVAAEELAVLSRQIARWNLRSRQARSGMLKEQLNTSRLAFEFSLRLSLRF